MKKLLKKFAAIGMAAMMIMAMGVTAFAAEEVKGEYDVKIFGPTGADMERMNPFVGADIDGSILTLYAEPIQVGAVTGYVDNFVVEGVEPEVEEETVDGVTYPAVLTYYFEEDVELDVNLDVAYNIVFTTGGTHPATTGSIQIVER